MFRIESKSKTHKPVSGRRYRGRQAVKPMVEVLEDRTLLSFNAPLTLPTGANTSAVAVGDFNGDGTQELQPVIGQQPLVAASDGPVSTRGLEALTPPPAQPAVVDADTRPHRMKQHRAEAADAVELDPVLLEAL
jgi:hypothetical protein